MIIGRPVVTQLSECEFGMHPQWRDSEPQCLTWTEAFGLISRCVSCPWFDRLYHTQTHIQYKRTDSFPAANRLFTKSQRIDYALDTIVLFMAWHS